MRCIVGGREAKAGRDVKCASGACVGSVCAWEMGLLIGLNASLMLFPFIELHVLSHWTDCSID